jgi:hypothetical protein
MTGFIERPRMHDDIGPAYADSNRLVNRAGCEEEGRALPSGASARPKADARPGRYPRKPKVAPDPARPGMWRVRWPNGRLSDITSLTRAKDAVACFIESGERLRRGRHSPLEGRLCVKTDCWGKGPAAE